MPSAGSQAVLVDLNAERSEALDEIARVTDSDQRTLIGEAIDAFIELHRWQIEHIKDGVRQADAGEFASPEDVARFFRLQT